MEDKQLIFIGGVHRSGKSLLHDILRLHPAISGFSNTGVPSDEGQHLQTVYQPAKAFGGPGNFGFNKASFMDNKHPLATSESSIKLLREWEPYWDLTKDYLLEQSPPNIVRSRFLQHIFPKSIFIIILRNPIAVAYATKKYSKASIPSLIEHTLHCYEQFYKDMPFLNRVYVLHYEELVLDPHEQIHMLLEWMGVEPSEFEFKNELQTNFTDKYFTKWNSDRHSLFKKLFGGFMQLFWKYEKYEKRANIFGYSLNTPKNLLPVSWAGPHNNT